MPPDFPDGTLDVQATDRSGAPLDVWVLDKRFRGEEPIARLAVARDAAFPHYA